MVCALVRRVVVQRCFISKAALGHLRLSQPGDLLLLDCHLHACWAVVARYWLPHGMHLTFEWALRKWGYVIVLSTNTNSLLEGLSVGA